MSPQRIQQRRTRGWRMPAGAVSTGRPGKWGNPWRVGTLVHHRCGDREWSSRMTAEEAVSFYETDLRAGLLPYTQADVRRELAGRDLVCWCPLDQPCHGDILLELANAD